MVLLGRTPEFQRNRRKATVIRYAKDMSDGNWIDGSSMIVLNDRGEVIDGQHRLAAQVMSNSTVEYAVMTGATDDMFKVLDSGARRRLSDRTGLSSKAQSIANAMCKYDSGAPIPMCMKSITSGSKFYVSEQDSISYTAENESVITHVTSLYSKVRKNTVNLSTAAFGTFYAANDGRGIADLECFIEDISSWNPVSPQAKAATASLQRLAARNGTPMQQFAVLQNAFDQYVTGYVPNMPTKAVISDKRLEALRKKVD